MESVRELTEEKIELMDSAEIDHITKETPYSSARQRLAVFQLGGKVKLKT